MTRFEDGATIEISVRWFRRFQYTAVTALVVLGTLFYLYADTHGEDAIHGMLQLFDPGSEESLPTTFSVLNLLLSCALLFVVHRHVRAHGEPMQIHWMLLSLVFLALAIDEGSAIHERAGARFYEFAGVALPLIQTHRWLLAGLLFTLIVAAVFVPFLLRLDALTRRQFVLAGTLFVSGALLFEFVGAVMMNEGGYTRADLPFRLRRIAEEGCEMFGIALFNCALMGLIRRRGITLGMSTRR